ncbi:hypothetical protein [Actinomadura sp. DC4]|nr:hypothetical protein [Actinomadura sp. DC4]MDN3354640.1 hypothetical protein [Actinomadura sp. DC4]
MTDKPQTEEEQTPATDDKEQIFHPNGMNPHAVPGKAPAAETDEDA